MNENENQGPGFFRRMVDDDGIQRAIATVVVSVVVAVAKDALFGKK